MALRVPAAPALAAATLLLLASCGGRDEPEPVQPVTRGDPAVAFAPLVLIDRRERWFPMSADRFLANSGLEWGGGPCFLERDVSASASSRALAAQSIPPLDPTRLGGDRPYRLRARRADCQSLRPQVFTTAQRTRPFDTHDRPAGLRIDEGFYLDILTDAQPGERRIARDGSLRGVPVYYARERTVLNSRPALRVSYWMLYGRGELADPAPDEQSYREGDWERVDVLVRPGPRPGTHALAAVDYHVEGRRRRVGWERAELAGPGGTHPVVYVERGTHTPRLRGECDDCVRWRAWSGLRDVRREPWYGYGGGWGSIEKTEASSGPLGPSPFEIGPAPRRRR